MIEVRIAGLVRHNEHRAVVLLDEARRRAVAVWVWWDEFWAINRGLEGFPLPFPTTHNMMANLIASTGAALEAVHIETLADDAGKATARLRSGTAVREVSARPGDALALATVTGSPIYVAPALMEGVGIPVTDGIEGQPGRLLDHETLAHIAAQSWDARLRPTMGGVDEVVEGLYIGGTDAIAFAEALRAAGVSRVLRLSPHEQHWPDDFVVFDNALEDNAVVPQGHFERGVSFIREQRDAGHKVLVACWAGVSRSSTFVLAYLVSALGYDLREAWERLRARHRRSWPAPEMWASLLAHYDLPYTMDDVKRWLAEASGAV